MEKERRYWRKNKLTPKQSSATEKAKALLEWFDQQTELPQELQLDVCTKITDVRKFIHSHRLGIANREPLSLDWRNYYMRLYEAKKIIENK